MTARVATAAQLAHAVDPASIAVPAPGHRRATLFPARGLRLPPPVFENVAEFPETLLWDDRPVTPAAMFDLHREFPAVELLRLHDAVLTGEETILLDGRTLLAESFAAQEVPHGWEPAGEGAEPAWRAAIDPAALPVLEGPVFWLDYHLSSAFGHLIYWGLARLIVLSRALPDLPLRIVVPRRFGEYFRFFAEALGLARVAFIHADRPVRVRDLLYVPLSWPGKSFFPVFADARAEMERIRRHAEAAAAGVVLPRRLYLSRRGAAYRRVLNEVPLLRALERHGFVEELGETLSPAEKIARIANAEALVFAHGSGSANVAFARPGATGLELFLAPSLVPAVDLRENQLACVAAGVGYGVVAGPAIADGPLDPNLYNADFLVPTETLERAIRRLGVAPGDVLPAPLAPAGASPAALPAALDLPALLRLLPAVLRLAGRLPGAAPEGVSGGVPGDRPGRDLPAGNLRAGDLRAGDLPGGAHPPAPGEALAGDLAALLAALPAARPDEAPFLLAANIAMRLTPEGDSRALAVLAHSGDRRAVEHGQRRGASVQALLAGSPVLLPSLPAVLDSLLRRLPGGACPLALLSPVLPLPMQVALLRRLAPCIDEGGRGGTILLAPPIGTAAAVIAAAGSLGLGLLFQAFPVSPAHGYDLLVATTRPRGAGLPRGAPPLAAEGTPGVLERAEPAGSCQAIADPAGRLHAAKLADGPGYALAGLAFRWRGSVRLLLSAGLAEQAPAESAAFGIVLDFRCGGSWRRLFLSMLGSGAKSAAGTLPDWGAGTAPAGTRRIGCPATLSLDLPALAPADWDGEVILSLRVEDTPPAVLGATIVLLPGR
nr:glycosyltransferase family 61 protein [Roseomonas acroporae]